MPSPNYHLEANGEFVIENYNQAKPFASFFPGIAGKEGIPLWLFYVNRGQCVCSMGVQDKEHPIMEFLPANWAYQLTGTQGFRTFLKLDGGSRFYEPFQDHFQDRDHVRTQRMQISPANLVLVEENRTLGLRIQVSYYTVPGDQYAGLIRELEISNTGSESIKLDGLDGLALLVPYGIGNGMLKNIRRLTEAFVEVINYEARAPMFKAKVEPSDRPEVVRLQQGNFYLGLQGEGEDLDRIQPIVDPHRIFGEHTDYAYPSVFIASSLESLLEGQILENRLPTAMSPFSAEIKPGKAFTLTSIIGHAESQEYLNALLPRISRRSYLEGKKAEYLALVDELTQNNLIKSADPRLDQYVRQNFLDNVLRGGFPYTLQGQRAQSVLHLYSRKHGDLERDYNDYRVTPTPFSQGNGNYRDINQNRRSDLFFNPDVGANNLKHFYNLIQVDGFNPLVIKEVRYSLNSPSDMLDILESHFEPGDLKTVSDFLAVPRTPGELVLMLRQKQIALKGSTVEMLGDLLAVCEPDYDTDHAEGYWSDHWTYNLDLLENYLAVYPEKQGEILFQDRTFAFHDSLYRVRPRDDKYVIWDGQLMQLDAVYLDEEKAKRQGDRNTDTHLLCTEQGNGPIYRTTLLVKLLAIIVNKMASLDPSGMGVEMETDKPNWYDALNGLPGLMGSSLSETLEIKRHIQFVLGALEAHLDESGSILVFEELWEFIHALQFIVVKSKTPFAYWNDATAVKEVFRERTRFGISGAESALSKADLKTFLEACLARLELGIAAAFEDVDGIPATYFRHQVVDHELILVPEGDGRVRQKTNAKGQACFRVKAFQCIRLPHFLEGPVHYLRTRPPLEKARALVDTLRESDLYDRQLGMYKVNASLAGEVPEIGRAHTFSPGWFENESIWLHMEYKYMLEILRNGLADAFYRDFHKVFVPFHDPQTYGRSILENSSFLVSSANPDPAIHGTGFVARLSGATAEFIHIFFLMTVGEKPFRLSPDGQLEFQPQPVLTGSLFTEMESKQELRLGGMTRQVVFPIHTFSFVFLGSILVRYHNPERLDTFGANPALPYKWVITDLDGKVETLVGRSLSGEVAHRIRDRQVAVIDIHLENTH